MLLRNLMLCCLITMGGIAMPAVADRVGINIDIGTPPPATRVEVVPAPRPGHVWAPGYWRWEGRRHVWVEGHWIKERRDHHWVPERWVEVENGHRYHFEPGHWEHNR